LFIIQSQNASIVASYASSCASMASILQSNNTAPYIYVHTSLQFIHSIRTYSAYTMALSEYKSTQIDNLL